MADSDTNGGQKHTTEYNKEIGITDTRNSYKKNQTFILTRTKHL